MRIVMDRNTCTTVLPACEECFATFVLHGCVPDRACIVDVRDDGAEETTLVLRYNNHEAKIVVTDENRELLAYDGWTQYVDVLPDFFSSGRGAPTPRQEKATLLLAEGNLSMRDFLQRSLSRATDIDLVGEAANGRDAIRQARRLKPAVVLTDVHLPDMNGLALAQSIHQQTPETRIVLLLDHDDHEYCEAAHEAGVTACIVKTAVSRELLPTLRALWEQPNGQ